MWSFLSDDMETGEATAGPLHDDSLLTFHGHGDNAGTSITQL